MGGSMFDDPAFDGGGHDDVAVDDNVPPLPAGLPHSGQVRMAYRLAHAYRDRLLYVHGLGWHFWDGRRWADDDIGAATRAVLAVLQIALANSLGDKDLQRDVRKCESASGIAGVLDIAGALMAFAATVRDLDADPYLLNVANGTLDLRTMELSAHNPADRITKVTRAAYDPAAPAEAWSRFLQRVLPHADVREYLQRVIGVALLGKVIEHVLPILTPNQTRIAGSQKPP
jgi:putative DNA primase/helicase